MKIAIIGLGTIGTGVVKILQRNEDEINKRSKSRIELKTICDLDLDTNRGINISKYKLTNQVDDILSDPEIDLVIELIGGYEPAKTFILKAIENKKHVVTANKAVMSKFGKEILSKAKENKVNVEFEASVGGCIPIISTLQNNLSPDNIKSISGILNGTTNYILTKMAEGQLYEDALKQAQELGFAEADPSFDVNGNDSAQKLAIMASIVTGKQFTEADVELHGITKITQDEMQGAIKDNKVIKLLGTFNAFDQETGQPTLIVKPATIENTHPLALINNETNAIHIIGDYVGDITLIGAGAGQLPTASAVISDIIKIINYKNY